MNLSKNGWIGELALVFFKISISSSHGSLIDVTNSEIISFISSFFFSVIMLKLSRLSQSRGDPPSGVFFQTSTKQGFVWMLMISWTEISCDFWSKERWFLYLLNLDRLRPEVLITKGSLHSDGLKVKSRLRESCGNNKSIIILINLSHKIYE